MSDVLDYDDLSPEDQEQVNEMLKQLNAIFDKYVEEDLDEEVPPST